MHLLDKTERDFIKEQIERNILSLTVEEPTKEEQIKSF